MAQCPGCGQKIPYFRIPNFRNTISNFSTYFLFHRYVCPLCDVDYVVDSFNFILFIIIGGTMGFLFAISGLPEIFLLEVCKLKAGSRDFDQAIPVCVLPVIFFMHYVWWTCFAKLR